LIDLLSGPCQQAANSGKPILLLIDDLEQILESVPENGRRRVREPERGVLRAVLRAFDPARSESRLLVTSRFPFSLIEGEVELAGKLHALQLSPFTENAQRKLSRRQVEAARTREEPGAALDETGLTPRLPLLARAQVVARGNPGLQDLVGDRLVLRPAVPSARAAAVLQEMEDYLAGGAMPSDTNVRVLQTWRWMSWRRRKCYGRLCCGRRCCLSSGARAGDCGIGGRAGRGPGALRALGLLDPFEDIVGSPDNGAGSQRAGSRAIEAADGSRRPRWPRLSAGIVRALGGLRPRQHAPVLSGCDIARTRLGLLAGNARWWRCAPPMRCGAGAQSAGVGGGAGAGDDRFARRGWAGAFASSAGRDRRGRRDSR
jgi:hypothetical protein